MLVTDGLPVAPVPACSGLALTGDDTTGEVTGEASGEAAGDALTPGLNRGAGEGAEGQRPQVAAQYPPAGAPAANMKAALHWPKFCCCWQVNSLLGGASRQFATTDAAV